MTQAHPDIWATIPIVSELSEQTLIREGQTIRHALPEPSETPETPTTQDELVSIQQPVPQPQEESTKHVLSPALTPVPEHADAEAVPALLVFGDEEDIKRVRKQRGSRKRRTLPELKNPVTVKEIAAALPTNEPPQAKQPEIVLYSLFEGMDDIE
jgi:hypothetical protein